MHDPDDPKTPKLPEKDETMEPSEEAVPIDSSPASPPSSENTTFLEMPVPPQDGSEPSSAGAQTKRQTRFKRPTGPVKRTPTVRAHPSATAEAPTPPRARRMKVILVWGLLLCIPALLVLGYFRRDRLWAVFFGKESEAPKEEHPKLAEFASIHDRIKEVRSSLEQLQRSIGTTTNWTRESALGVFGRLEGEQKAVEELRDHLEKFVGWYEEYRVDCEEFNKAVEAKDKAKIKELGAKLERDQYKDIDFEEVTSDRVNEPLTVVMGMIGQIRSLRKAFPSREDIEAGVLPERPSTEAPPPPKSRETVVEPQPPVSQPPPEPEPPPSEIVSQPPPQPEPPPIEPPVSQPPPQPEPPPVPVEPPKPEEPPPAPPPKAEEPPKLPEKTLEERLQEADDLFVKGCDRVKETAKALKDLSEDREVLKTLLVHVEEGINRFGTASLTYTEIRDKLPDGTSIDPKIQKCTKYTNYLQSAVQKIKEKIEP